MLAVDIGGTKMAVGVVDRDGGLANHDQVPTAGEDADGVFATLVGLIDRIRSDTAVDLTACGVGCGGPMARNGETVSPLNIAPWREFPLRARLAEHLGIETFVDNDAKALALAEGWRGEYLRGRRRRPVDLRLSWC